MRRRRRVAAGLALALALAAGGCGAEEIGGAPARLGVPEALTTPGDGPLPLPPPPRPRVEVPAGEVGVVDVTGRGGVRPAALEIAADAAVGGIAWRRWTAQKAVGAGRMRLLTCDPSCGQGGAESVRVRVTLSQPRRCPGGSFFARATVTIPGDPRRPASFVQAPC